MLDIIFQDQDLIVINKPSGLLSIRDGYNPDLPTVKSILEENFGPCWVVHRLDKETSGVIIFARNSETHRLLNISFQNRRIEKVYHAIVIGHPEERVFTLSYPLRINGDRYHRTVIDNSNGKPSKTLIKCLEGTKKFCQISVFPYTGYTHQIRSHLAYAGFPILGDLLYGKQENFHVDSNKIISRTALHAFQLQFFHPVSGLQMEFSACYPEDFAEALTKIKSSDTNAAAF